jgi:hypothetical protein
MGDTNVSCLLDGKEPEQRPTDVEIPVPGGAAPVS